MKDRHGESIRQTLNLLKKNAYNLPVEHRIDTICAVGQNCHKKLPLLFMPAFGLMRKMQVQHLSVKMMHGFALSSVLAVTK